MPRKLLNNIEDPDLILLSKEEAKELYECLSREYISHIQFPLVHKLLDEIYEKFLRKI